MKALWIDTGPLLDLTIVTLQRRSSDAYRHLGTLVRQLTNPTRERDFFDQIRRFGELRYSSGTLVELDRLVRGVLRKSHRGNDIMKAFWQTFDSSVPELLQRPLSGQPLERADLKETELARLGPVDAHLLAALRKCRDDHLVTIDRTLQGIAAATTHERAKLLGY